MGIRTLKAFGLAVVLAVCAAVAAQTPTPTQLQVQPESQPEVTPLRLGELRIASESQAGGVWTTVSPQLSTGYVKLVTPIVHNEQNMFSIRITGYLYFYYGDPVDILCAGYAYSGSTLISQSCHADGIDFPVEIATELRPGGTAPVVVIRLGTPDRNWYFAHFSAEYVGWNAKAASAGSPAKPLPPWART